MSASLDALLEHPALWRGAECARNAPALATGFAALDRCLPGGGWPQGALSELLASVPGSGELSLLMPACARLTHTDRWVIFVAPPYIPYAPALASAGVDLSRLLLVRAESRKDALWALEQALKSRHCGAAIGWLDRSDDASLRRLQLSCEQGGSCGFLFMPQAAARNASPAALRLGLAPCDEAQLAVHVLKRRGGPLARPIRIDPRCP
jgi:cell division inhibitor SulA/protein ImuA